jgi:hypothetical protein
MVDLAGPPSAIFTTNNIMTLGAMSALVLLEMIPVIM